MVTDLTHGGFRIAYEPAVGVDIGYNFRRCAVDPLPASVNMFKKMDVLWGMDIGNGCQTVVLGLDHHRSGHIDAFQ